MYSKENRNGFAFIQKLKQRILFFKELTLSIRIVCVRLVNTVTFLLLTINHSNFQRVFFNVLSINAK